MVNSVVGKVHVVGKSISHHGLKLEDNPDVWYNVAHKVQNDLISPELKGRTVRLSLNEKGRIVDVEVLQDEGAQVQADHSHYHAPNVQRFTLRPGRRINICLTIDLDDLEDD